MITKNKLIIIVCDNGGFAAINRLQLFKGGKEYNNLLKSSNTPGLVDVISQNMQLAWEQNQAC